MARKGGRLVYSDLTKRYFFLTKWRQNGKAVEALDADRCRWDCTGDVEAIEDAAIKATLLALIRNTEPDDERTQEYLRSRVVGPRQVSWDTPDEVIEARRFEKVGA